MKNAIKSYRGKNPIDMNKTEYDTEMDKITRLRQIETSLPNAKYTLSIWKSEPQTVKKSPRRVSPEELRECQSLVKHMQVLRSERN